MYSSSSWGSRTAHLCPTSAETDRLVWTFTNLNIIFKENWFQESSIYFQYTFIHAESRTSWEGDSAWISVYWSLYTQDKLPLSHRLWRPQFIHTHTHRPFLDNRRKWEYPERAYEWREHANSMQKDPMPEFKLLTLMLHGNCPTITFFYESI